MRDWQEITQINCNHLIDILTGDKLCLTNGNISKGYDNKGYRMHSIYDKVLKKYRHVQAHRLVYSAIHPTWNLFSSQSEGEIHHKDENPLNNHHSNLKFLTSKRKHTQLSSNFKGGVSFIESLNKYQAKIKDKGKSYYLGLCGTEAEARQVYLKAEREIELGLFNPQTYLKRLPNPFPGISFDKTKKHWRLYTTINGKQKSIARNKHITPLLNKQKELNKE